MTKKLIILIALSFLLERLSAQNIVAFQGFEGTAADNWAYTPPAQGGGTGQINVGSGNFGAAYAKTGSNSIRAGGGSTGCGTGSASCINGASTGGSCNSNPNGKIVQFNAVNIECLSGVQISVAHRSHVLCAGQGAGFDSGESLFFEVSLNGGSWTAVGTLGGAGNTTWTYATNPAGGSSTVTNPFVYNVPAGTITIAFRTRCQSDRADEIYYLDDIKLTTITNGYNFPGTAGMWNGKINTDWTNKCNWEDRNIPGLSTDVLIPNGAINICEVLATKTGNCRNLVIDKAKLAVEYFTSTLNVNGNLTIDNNGELDMSLAGLEGGSLNISGNWNNKRDPSYFGEGRSTINFVGLANQTISVINDTKEIFFKTSLNKGNGVVAANTDIWIDTAITGGTANMLTLSNGQFDLNNHSLVIYNPNYQALLRTGGGIISEKSDNSSKIIWKMNSNTGNYIFPFIKTDGYYIPFTFNHTSGNAGDVTIATYGTPPNNLPWPTTPDLVTNLTSYIGLLPDNRNATVDRFWQIDVIGSATADLTFSYAPTELPGVPYNIAGNLKAQRYAVSSNVWQPYLSGQTAGAYLVTVPNVNTFSPWTLTSTLSPLPIGLMHLTAVQEQKNVKVAWTTAMEIDNDYFSIMRSKDNQNFEEIGKVDAVGNSSGIENYHYMDEKPYKGISFYRLKQTDFNGNNNTSNSVTVNCKSTFSNAINVSVDEQNVNISSGDIMLAVELIDAYGKRIYTYNSSIDNYSFSINVAELSKGIYFLRVVTKYGEEIKKIVLF